MTLLIVDRISGEAVLGDDDARSGLIDSQTIALGGFPMDSHDPLGSSMDGTERVSSAYGIPYGALVPRGVGRMLVAGRCISAERKALASARVTGTSMAMGQAAGVAAALRAASGENPRDLDVATLQDNLASLGAVLE